MLCYLIVGDKNSSITILSPTTVHKNPWKLNLRAFWVAGGARGGARTPALEKKLTCLRLFCPDLRKRGVARVPSCKSQNSKMAQKSLIIYSFVYMYFLYLIHIFFVYLLIFLLLPKQAYL